MADAAETAPSLPYHEPAVVPILVQSSFLLLLNVVNATLDRLVYCGLLGQVFIGIAWGTPVAKWLSVEVEEVVVQLGYLGLLLLVYEGGLSTSFQSLKANLLLSSAVAFTGIAVPIALSYTLQGLLNATPLQAFAAGAALCSTSLGTTFTVLASSGLSQSRLGVVLTIAAMMDDVVGLVMVQVISNLGGGNIGAVTVVRPILVSIAFAVVVPLASRFILKPLTLALNRYRESRSDPWVSRLLRLRQTAFAMHTALLLALVIGSSYAGTSNLFAAYIAGAVISWWDSEVPHLSKSSKAVQKASTKEKMDTSNRESGERSPPEICVNAADTEIQNPISTAQDQPIDRKVSVQPQETTDDSEETTGSAIYEQYYHQAVARILQPLFFASIGFSIPITRMFQGSIVWRGIVYTLLMTLGKLVCGLWLVRFSVAPMTEALRALVSKINISPVPYVWGRSSDGSADPTSSQATSQARPAQTKPVQSNAESSSHTFTALKPVSLQPPLILAFAMTARGEIGFLISAVAEANGVFLSGAAPENSESDIFLVVTWAIVLCTILGPLGVGLTVRRVKKLQERKEREQEGSGRDVLGAWGVE